MFEQIDVRRLFDGGKNWDSQFSASSVPAVPAACKGNALLKDDGCKRQGYEDFEKISFWKTPTTQCASGNNQCIPYHKWVSDYIAVLGGR